MKKIELKKTLEERVRDTEWTDANTWNVLRKIRSAKSLRSEFSLRRLAPAAVALLLVMGIGITALTRTPGGPDPIRENDQYTAQPLVTALSGGQGEGTGDLPEEAVGCEDSLLPVNLGCEDSLLPVNLGCERQGIRVDVVAGLAAGNESYVKYAIQDIENKYPGLEMEPEKMINTILPEDCDADGTMYADEIMTCDVNVDEPYRNMYIIGNHHSRKIQGEDQEITLGIRDMRIMQRTDIDLHPYIQEYAKPEEGISREGYKILDPEKKLSIPLGREDLLLTGIGWIDNQLHVRIEYTGESFVKNVTSHDNVCDVWISGDLIHPTETRSGVDYTMLTSGTTKYEEILDCGPDNYGEVSLIAHCSVLEDVVQGNWSVNLPLSMICPEIEPAVDAAEAVREQMEINYPGIADQLRTINLSSEKDGVRLEVVSGLVKDYESWIVYSAQDVEGKYPESMLRAICNDNVSGAEYGGETPFLFADEKEHKYYFCNHIVYDEPVNKADRLISVTMDSYEVQREVKLDLAQLLKEHGTTSEGVLSPELMPWITAEGPVPQGKVTVLDYNKPLNIPVLGDVLLTGAGWIDGKIHVQFHNPDAHGIPGERVSVLSNWTVSLYYDDEYWKEDLYDSALWDENGDDCNDWEEIILNCDQEYLEKMNAQVNVTVTDALVEKQMEVKVPLNLICGDVEPAEAEGAENLLDPDAAESIRQFFSFWAGRDAKYMIQPLSNNWHKSVADGFAFTHSLIASGTPRSYQINNVSGWSGDAERVVTCTVEMENPVGEEPMHRQYEFTIRKGEYWYEIDPTGFAHWKTGNYDPAVEMVYLDEESAVRDYLENNYGDYLTDRLVPINRSSENMGIRYDLLSGFVTEDDGWFVCSVQDIAATDGAFPDKIWMDGDIGEAESFSQMVMYRNAAEHKTVYLVYVKYKQPVEDENRTVSMNLQSVDVNREGAKADLVPLLKGYAKTVEGVELPQLAKAILEHRFTGPTEVPGLKVLDYTKPQDIPLFKDTYLANAGWIDGKLHIQIRSTYKTKDGYTDLWFNTLLGGETEFLQKEMDYSPLDWYDDTAYWYEYVFDFAPEDLDKLEMTINCLFAQATLENVWNARFPLNTIYVKSKTDANEAWRTPLLDRVDEFFTAWQNGDTESMLAMCGAHWRDQQGILVRILDNRVPESWKVSEIRGLQTPVATVGIDIHMQPEDTNGVYLVKMKKETDGIWYFEPDGLYVVSDSDLLLLPGGMQDEEVILTGTPKNSEAKTEVPPFVGVVTDFLTCWNKGDTDGMLALCQPSMRDEGYSNSMKYLVTGFGKPLEWKLGQLYGAPGDESRGVACKIQFRLGNDDLAWYSFDIVVTKDTNVQWYINPASISEATAEITGTLQSTGKKADNNIGEDKPDEQDPTPSPAPAARSGRPVRVDLELGKDKLSGPETIDVTITVTNVSGDKLAGPVTLYDPDGNQVAEYSNEDFAAGETKEWTGKWTVTEEQLADGKVGFSVKYSDYKEGTQDIMAHKLTFSKAITKEEAPAQETASPAPAERSGRPVRVGLELGKDTLSGPETIDVTITVTNVSGDTLAGPVTLYDPDGNQVTEYSKEDFAAGETKEWSGKWTVTEEQLADGKVSFSVKYSDYKEGTQDIMAHKLTFSKPITKE